MSNRSAGSTRRRSSRPTPPRPGTTPASAGSGRGKVLWIAIGAVILIAAVIGIAIAASGGDDDDPGAVDRSEIGGVETIGDDLPPLSQVGEGDAGLGATVPFVSAETFDGERITIESDAGARIYGFFAHWCPVCQRELPVISDFLTDPGLPGDVDFWAISTAVDPTRGNYPPSEWFAGEDYPLPVLKDSPTNMLASAFGLPAYPYFVVVNEAGEVVFRITGELTPEQLGELALIAQQR